jgi:ribonuclease-3
MTDLQAALGHSFANPALLEEALTHRSFIEERHPGGNAPLFKAHDRLALIGDAWVKLFLLKRLLPKNPTALAGDITKVLGPFVSNEAMRGPATHLQLFDKLRLGRGARAEAARDLKLLATTFEAVLGAMVLDGGEAAAEALVLSLTRGGHWTPAEEGRDPVIVFGEWHQATFKGSFQKPDPERSGPDHAPVFTYEVWLPTPRGPVYAAGSGANKQLAWRDTARVIVEALRGLDYDLR